MNEFIVDFTRSLGELAEFQLRLGAVGTQLDKLEAAGKKSGSSAGELMKGMNKAFTDFERMLEKAGTDTNTIEGEMRRLRQTASMFMSGLAASNLKATIAFEALSGNLSETNALMADTASKNAYAASMQRINTINETMVNSNNELRAKIQALETEEGKLNVQLREQYALAQQALRTQKTEISQRDQLLQKLRQLETAEGQEIANLKEEIRAREQAATATAKMVTENQKLRAARDGLDTELGQENAQLREQIKLREQEITAADRLVNENQKLRQAKEALNSELGKENALLKQGIRNREQEVQFTSAQIGALQKLNLEYNSLNGGLGESIARQNQINSARKQEITEDQRLAIEIEKVKRSIESLNGGLAEQLQALKAVEGQRKKQITDSNTQKEVIDEVTAALKREEEQLRKLQAQANLLSGPNGKRVTELRNEIAAQTQLNNLRSMSTGALLGFGKSQRELNIAQEVGSQSAAMMRAGLTGLHASVGMYTSATVLAATGTYAFTAALRDSIVTGAEFQATMSRTRAVMSSGENGIGVSDQSFKALETQVRALGQTTVFTASEVAQGLQQLGMAGFSASDSMTALPATLQLANLANVDMAKSADIATNVLMTFNMEAKELQGVVDLMATAVNNSNADIDQLATTLKYAGPAAHTAGISLQETVAAAEALANSGIKGSNAGSALRRLFVSLLNPTKKGAAMLDQYGISVLDAQGNTRSLVDIIGQLNKALSGLSGADRLTAIQNLVGVYATSSVSALVDQYKNFEQFANQNTNVEGAGDRMEKIISDNLQFDWKAMLSALEELQLQAFDSMNGRLRELVNGISLEVLKLMEPVNTVFSEKLGQNVEITGLDRLIQQLETAVTVAGYAVAGFTAFKLSSGAVGGALASVAADLGGNNGVSARLKELQSRLAVTEQSQSLMSRSVDAGKLRWAALRAEVTATSGAMGYATLATRGLVVGLNGLAIAGAAVARAFGWVGLVYGIGSAIYSLFSSDTDSEVLKHKEGVDATRESYSKMRDEIEKAGLAKQRAAIQDQLTADKDIVTEIKGKISTTQQTISQGEKANISEQGLKGQREYLESLEAQLRKYETKITDTEAQLGSLEQTNESYSRSMNDQLPLIQDVTRATNALAEARIRLAQLGITDPTAIDQATVQEQVVLAAAREKAESFGRTAVNIKPATTNFQQLKDQADLLAGIEAEQEAYKRTATDNQKLADTRAKLNQVLEQEGRLIKENANALNSDDSGPGLDQWKRTQTSKVELLKQEKELSAKVAEQTEKLRLAEQKGSSKVRTDEENNAANRKRIAELNAEIAAVSNPTEGQAVDIEKKTALINERTGLQQELNAIEKRAESASKRGQSASDKAAREAEQRAKTDLSTYTALAKKFDEVSAAELEMKKGIEAMARLRQGQIIDGKRVSITAEEEARAVAGLKLAYYDAVVQMDKLAASRKALRDGYTNDVFGSDIQQLADLNLLLDKGYIKLDEYIKLRGNLTDKGDKAFKDSLPTADLAVGEASSSPFTDYVNTQVNTAKGLKQYGDQDTELDKTYSDRMSLLDRNYATELERAGENQKMQLELQDQYHADSLAAMEQYGLRKQQLATSQAQYVQETSKMADIAMIASMANVVGQFASASSDANALQLAAFAVQKGLAIAQILMYSKVAAARAIAELGVAVGTPIAATITTTGYINAALVGALAVAEVVGNRSSSSGSSSGGTKMYDTGGTIPYNRVGIVGEYGPELVSGPAHVTGRGATANRTQNNGESEGSPSQLVLSPTFNVTAPDSSQDSMKAAAQFADLSSKMFMKHIGEAMRTNGALDKWYRSKVGK